MLSGINTSVFADMITEMPEGNIESTWRAEVESPSDAGREIIKRLTSSNADKVVVEKATPNNAVMFAAAGETLESDVIQITQNGSVQELTLVGGICRGNGYTIEKSDENIYTLSLNNFVGNSIRIGKGVWTIELLGDNTVTLNTGETKYGAVDIRGEETEATIEGTGKLVATGYQYGLYIENKASVTMKSGEVETHATQSGLAIGVCVDHSGFLEVSGGKLTGECERGMVLSYAGKMTIAGGEVIAKGIYGNGMEMGIDTELTVSGGTLTAIGNNSSKSGICVGYEGAKIRIEDNGRVEASGREGIFLGERGTTVSLTVSGENAYLKGTLQTGWNSTTTVESGGKLESDYIYNGGKFYLKDGGELILNGTYKKDTYSWSGFYKQGGKISGSGSFAEGSEIGVKVTYAGTPREFRLGTSYELDKLFNVTTDGLKSEIGKTTYNVDTAEIATPGNATIDGNKIRFTKIGTINLKAEIAKKGYYSGSAAAATIKIIPYALENRVMVSTYSGEYDGKSHPAVTVLVDGKDPQELGLKVEYAKNKSGGGFDDYTTECPEVKEVSDSERYFRIKLSGEDYNTYYAYSDKVSITRKPASQQDGWSIEIKETDFTYNRSPQEPEIVVKRGDHTLEEGTDYDIVYYYKIVPQGVEKCAKPIDVGRYYVGVSLRKNYSGYIYSNENHAEGQSGTFEIHPQTLTAKIASSSLQYMKKAYDGTPNGTANMRDRLQIELYAGTEKITYVYVDKSEVHFLFSDADVGKNKKLQVIGIKLSGYTDNYVCSGIAETDEAEITPGKLQECELQAADLLEYTGEPQKPAVKYTVVGFNVERINKFDVTYATAKYGDYKEEIPSFTTPGTYYVYYRLSAKNYETENKYFSVTVMPADLNGAEIRLKKPNLVYTGKSLKTDVEVVYKGHILPETSYQVSYEKADDAGTSFERMDGAKDAGSYKVWVTGGTGYTDGEKAADDMFIITPKPLDDTITVTFQQEKAVYDTMTHQPKIIVKDMMIGAELVENVDYTAEYLGDWKDSGKHILRLTGVGENGKGNYKGTLDVDYEITKANFSQASVTVNGSYTYEAAEQRPSKDQVEVKLDGRVVDPDEYELSYQDNISAGTDAKVIVTAKADGNYMNQAEGSFTIKPTVLKISGAVLKKKVYDGQKNGEVESLIFEGLKGSDRLLPEGQDYEATAEFSDVNAGNGKSVQIAGKLKSTENTKNYSLEGDTFLLEGQKIEKAPAPELEIQQISMPYDTKGEQRIELAILPEDCGTVYDAKAAIIPKHADVQIVRSVRMDGTTVILSLEYNSRRMIGETVVIAVDGIRTTNYEDMSGKIELVLTDGDYQESWDSDDSDSGNQDKNVSSNVKNPRGWLLDGKGWRLRFPKGTYAKGSIAGTDASGNRLVKYHWEMVNDRWYAFDENGYLKTGMFHDAGYNGMFYVDEDLGMHTGWKLINGKWYYFKVMSDGTKGIMLRSQRTPDGYYVNENGEWDGK